MDAVKFLEELKRMCINNEGCNDCPVNVKSACSCKLEHIPECYEDITFDNLVAFVEKWSAEHPQKTRLMDFLEKYPTAPTENGIPYIRPWHLGYCEATCCDECGHMAPIYDLCYKCWNLPLIPGNPLSICPTPTPRTPCATPAPMTI